MKLIKEVVEGKATYRKARKAEYEKEPTLKYKPTRRYSNAWYFANTGRNACEQVWEIGQSYYQRLQQASTRPPHINKHPVQLIKYFYLLYLTGARRNELLDKPYPEIEVVNTPEGVHILVNKLNSKHRGPQGEREIISQALPVMCTAEQDMWNFVLDGGLTTRINDILKLDTWRLSKVTISQQVKNNFRINLKDQAGDLHRNAGITPHVLRHMRAFNILINHHVPPVLAIKWFGWRKEQMLYYYAHIQKMLSQTNQMEMLRSYNLLTKLRIDAGRKLG